MKPELPSRTPEEAAFDERVARLVAPIFKRSNDLSGSMREAALLAAEEMRRECRDEAEIAPLLADWLKRWGEDNPTFVSQALQCELVETFVGAGGERPKQLLIEKEVETETGYRMFLWPNESKHPGNPHVTVDLNGTKINVAICEDPKVIAGPKSLPGIGAVLKTVARHRDALLSEWNATRPDDQKVENFKSKAKSSGSKDRKKR